MAQFPLFLQAGNPGIPFASVIYFTKYDGSPLWQFGAGAVSGSQQEFGLYDAVGGSWRLYVNPIGNVGIGTTNPQYLLSVKGTIGAQEFIVTNTGWSDYVFQPDYRLRPLREVGEYIEANHHLPGIPSEAEVKEKGVNMGEMQAKLLAKIEELTLHMIQQEKENQELRSRITRLEGGDGATPASALMTGIVK